MDYSLLIIWKTNCLKIEKKNDILQYTDFIRVLDW